jgi:hypothetical protein
VLSQGSSEPAWYRINRLLLIHLGLHFNSNQILKDYDFPHFGGAQYIYLLFISYEPRTVNKTADVRIVFSQQKEAQLANNIFGDSGDPLNLQSQYKKACSYDQLQFNAVRSNIQIGTDGIYTVYLPTTNITGASKMAMLAAAVNEATADLGDLTSIAHHVMVCLPPGTTGSWVAHAYVNHWLSVYNNNYCLYPSPQMHEIGKLWFTSFHIA